MKPLEPLFKEYKLDLLWIKDPVNLYYLTKLNLSAGCLFIYPKKMILFVDGRYYAVVKDKSPCSVFLLDEKNIKSHLLLKGKKKIVMGFDSSTTSYEEFKKKEIFLKKLGEFQLVPMNQPFRELRLIKNAQELIILKKSAKIAWQGYQHIKEILKPGIKEKEVALEFEIFCRKKGAEKMAFNPIIAFGRNTAYPHHYSSGRALKKNDVVLCDLGVVYNNYCSDFTRTFFFGKSNPQLKKLRDLVKEAHLAALKLCRPGTRFGELDQAARAVFAREGLESYFVHGLGHGVGLEVHEPPRIKWDSDDKDLILKPGMVFTIEPGLYLPGKGGIRYEDTIVITTKGYQNFYA